MTEGITETMRSRCDQMMNLIQDSFKTEAEHSLGCVVLEGYDFEVLQDEETDADYRVIIRRIIGGE